MTKALLTSTRFKHKEVLRACIVNYMTGASDNRTTVDEVIAADEYLLSLPRN